MELELRFFANFRDAVGQKTIYREYDDVNTMGDVLRELDAEFPEMEILDDEGAPREYASIMRNGEDVTHIDGMKTEIGDGDRVSAFPPVAGG